MTEQAQRPALAPLDPRDVPPPSPGRRRLRTALTILHVLGNAVLIHQAVDVRAPYIATDPTITSGTVDPEFVPLAIRTAVVLTVVALIISYVILRGLEALLIRHLRPRAHVVGGAHTVDLTTSVVFAFAAFAAPDVARIAAAAPGWLLAVVVLSWATLLSARAPHRARLATFLFVGVCCATTLLGYGRWA